MIRAAVYGACAALVLATPVAAQPYDHLKVYRVKPDTAVPAFTMDLPALQPPFSESGCTISGKPRLLLVPVDKTNVTPAPPNAVRGPSILADYVCYKVKCQASNPPASVSLPNQFATHTLTKLTHKMLCVPAPKCCPVCGDGVCEGDETACNCLNDCSLGGTCAACLDYVPVCGNGLCEPCASPGESHQVCPQDCPLLCHTCTTTTTTSMTTTTTMLPGCALHGTPPQCSGTCPNADDVCVWTGTTVGCGCVKADQVCSNLVGAACTMGFCPRPDQQCSDIGGTPPCGCVPP
jgi:hypothetical protein